MSHTTYFHENIKTLNNESIMKTTNKTTTVSMKLPKDTLEQLDKMSCHDESRSAALSRIIYLLTQQKATTKPKVQRKPRPATKHPK